MRKTIIITTLLAVIFCKFSYAGYHFVPYGFDSEQEWQSLVRNLQADTDTRIVLNWQGQGGYVNIMQDFVREINLLKAKGKIIVFYIVGPSASAHAVAVCSGSEIMWGPKGLLMFHPATDGSSFDIPADLRAIITDMLMGCVNKGLLTFEDLHRSLTDSEVYVVPRNGNIKKLIIPDPRQKH